MSDSKLRSYSSPYNLGHKATDEFWGKLGTIFVQEKIDGSQISFGKDEDGELHIKSHKAVVHVDNPGMFSKAVETIVQISNQLVKGFTFRGEYVSKPKHNTIAYDNAPDKWIVIYDIDCGDQDYMSPEDMAQEANRLGLLYTPVIAIMTEKPTIEELDNLLLLPSLLGGDMEGVVLKNYALFDPWTHKVFMVKYVSAEFKEKHKTDWKGRNPNKASMVESIIESLTTEARWNKAIQHLTEVGELEGSPRDIGKLIKEVQADIEKDDAEEIAELLYQHFRKQIMRGVTRGLPEFYKDKLVKASLE